MNLPELAKMAVENYIKEGKIISSASVAQGLPEKFLKEKSGVFVTIEKNGGLRGCIGTYLPIYGNITQEAINNAIAAATQDGRFDPVENAELPFLSYMVYIISKPDPVRSMEELDPEKYGVVVKSVGKSGLLLPGLEGIKTIAQQISIACQKAGIDPSKEKLLIYKFEVAKYQ